MKSPMHFLITAAGLFLALINPAQDFSFKITSTTREFTQGTPVIVDAEEANISGKPIQVVYFCLNQGFSIRIDIRRVDGKDLQECLRRYVEAARCLQPSATTTLPADWRQQVGGQLQACFEEPGDYTVQFIRSAPKGPVQGYDYLKKESKLLYGWHGEVRSEEVKIRIVPPEGVDKEAFDVLSHEPLSPQHWGTLECKYPDSIYAAYAWMRSSAAHTGTGPAKAYFERSAVQESMDRFNIHDCKNGGEVGLTQLESQKYRIRVASQILKNHPRFHYRNNVRFALALGYLGLKKYPEAAAQFQIIAQEPDCADGQRAKEFLSAMREKKLIK